MFESVRQSLNMTDEHTTVQEMRDKMVHWINCNSDHSQRISQLNEHKFRESEFQNRFWITAQNLNEQTPMETVLSAAFHDQWEQYLNEMKAAAYTGGMEILAISEMFHVNIIVWTFVPHNNSAIFTTKFAPSTPGRDTVHMPLVGRHHYEYLDLPKTFLPYFDFSASRSSRSNNVPEPTTVHSKTKSHQPQSSPAPHQRANLPVIQVTQDLLDKVHLLTQDTAIKSLRCIIHDQLSSQHDSLTYWASHIQVTQAENVFTLFDQNMTSQRLAACLSVPCPDRGTGHWLSVDLLNVSIGMFL